MCLMFPTSAVIIAQEHHHMDHKTLMKEDLLTKSRRAANLSNFANGTTAERDILMEFYGATNGPQWCDSPSNNWGSSGDHCKGWTGVECDDERRVVGIEIDDNNQGGYLSSSLGSLASLEYLNLAYGSIGGGVPHELFELRNEERRRDRSDDEERRSTRRSQYNRRLAIKEETKLARFSPLIRLFHSLHHHCFHLSSPCHRHS